MNKQTCLLRAFVTVSLIVTVAGRAAAAHDVAVAGGQNMAEMKFDTVAGIPTCGTAAMPDGDPAKGAAFILAKTASGCIIPWHWHTADEHLIIVKGVVRLDMKDGKPLTLRAGGFAAMPGKYVHQFRCRSACVFYVYVGGPFDIHYVDAQGMEIAPDVALKAVKETAAAAPK